MRLDKYGNPIFNSQDVFSLIYQGKREYLKDIFADLDIDLQTLETVAEFKFLHPLIEDQSINEYDYTSQQQWFMPDAYKQLDIEDYIFNKIDINNNIQATRVAEELLEFKNRDMYNLLRWLVYFVETCIKEEIVWGVGRGSSVSSYVLYLIGVHKIDSLKYNLNWADFLR